MALLHHKIQEAGRFDMERALFCFNMRLVFQEVVQNQANVLNMLIE